MVRLAALFTLAFGGAIAVRSVLQERAYLYPPRRNLTPLVDSQGIPGLTNVEFTTEDAATIHGWYAPSTNGAAVIILHGSMSDRRSAMSEARLLTQDGFGMLAFDWPRHGESTGTVQWGANERHALTAALDWLAVRPGVDPHRLGAIGLSLGGYVLAQVAATDSRLRAVALVGTPSNATELTRREHRRFGPFSVWPALWVQNLFFEPDTLPAERMVDKISPRALLVVTGDDDDVVPESMAHALFRAAREPKRLLVVHGAGHGGYDTVEGSTYTETLRSFFREWLNT